MSLNLHHDTLKCQRSGDQDCIPDPLLKKYPIMNMNTNLNMVPTLLSSAQNTHHLNSLENMTLSNSEEYEDSRGCQSYV